MEMGIKSTFNNPIISKPITILICIQSIAFAVLHLNVFDIFVDSLIWLIKYALHIAPMRYARFVYVRFVIC